MAKSLFLVSFLWDTDSEITCTNIARAESADAAQLYYERGHHVFNVRQIDAKTAEAYRRRGMPVVNVPSEQVMNDD